MVKKLHYIFTYEHLKYFLFPENYDFGPGFLTFQALIDINQY